MAPPARPRHTRIPKEKFSVYFGHLKSQPYIEAPAGRGAGSHHRCVCACACACARLSCEAHLERGSSRKARSMLTTTAAVVSVLLPGILSGPLSRQALRTRRFVSVSCLVVPHPLGVPSLPASVAGNPEKPNVRFSTELKGHLAGIEKIAFNPVKDAELCSVSNDGVVKFWDVRTKTCVNEVKGLGNAHSLAWAPDGSSLLVGNRVGLLNHASLDQDEEASTKPRWYHSVARSSRYHRPNPPWFPLASYRSTQPRWLFVGAGRKSSSRQPRAKSGYSRIPSSSPFCTSTTRSRTESRQSSCFRDIPPLA